MIDDRRRHVYGHDDECDVDDDGCDDRGGCGDGGGDGDDINDDDDTMAKGRTAMTTTVSTDWRPYTSPIKMLTATMTNMFDDSRPIDLRRPSATRAVMMMNA